MNLNFYHEIQSCLGFINRFTYTKQWKLIVNRKFLSNTPHLPLCVYFIALKYKFRLYCHVNCNESQETIRNFLTSFTLHYWFCGYYVVCFYSSKSDFLPSISSFVLNLHEVFSVLKTGQIMLMIFFQYLSYLLPGSG